MPHIQFKNEVCGTSLRKIFDYALGYGYNFYTCQRHTYMFQCQLCVSFPKGEADETDNVEPTLGGRMHSLFSVHLVMNS